MGETTAIAWTDHTFNPWHGCTRVSPGCQNCYAEAFSKRIGKDIWGKNAERRFFGDKHWAEPEKWDRAAAKAGRPALVFCASMADVFEDRDDLHEPRSRLWDLIDRTPHLIWQLLTKRPENVDRLIPFRWFHSQWPSTVWLGTTVEDQERAVGRIPELLLTRARVKFLSCEPLIGPVDLAEWLLARCPCMDRPAVYSNIGDPNHDGAPDECPDCYQGKLPSPIDWVICGGESGAGHRPLALNYARVLRDQCGMAGVPFFFKQVGGQRPTSGGDMLDGSVLKAFPTQAMREAVGT